MSVPPRGLVEAAIRSAAPRALAVMVRRTGDFHDAEDALQEALLDAARQWPVDGIPTEPVAWLCLVAARRWIDGMRSNSARRERELRSMLLEPPPVAVPGDDDSLDLLLLCCHPALSPSSQVALTLRALGGMTTREVARGLLQSESTVAQRISRAKATLRALPGGGLSPDPSVDPGKRIHAVLTVIGLIHTESHSATDGDALVRPALGAESLRLARMLLARAPLDAAWRGEVMGLVALILLTDARAPARVDATGDPVPLTDQDRSLWRRDWIDEGVALLEESLQAFPLGPFQLRAAIAAVHDEAPSEAETDRRQLLALYALLRAVDPGPVSELGWTVALAGVHGPDSALRELDRLQGAPPHRVAAVRAHLLRRAGRDAEASVAARDAARLSPNAAEARWLESSAGRRKG